MSRDSLYRLVDVDVNWCDVIDDHAVNDERNDNNDDDDGVSDALGTVCAMQRATGELIGTLHTARVG